MTDDIFDNHYFYLNKFLLSCIGLWPFHSRTRNFFIQCFVISNLSLFLVFLVAGFVKSWGNTNKMIECIPVIFTTAGSLIFIFIIFFKQNEFCQFYREIKFDWEFWSSSKQEFSIISEYASHGKLFNVFCTCGTIGVVVIYLLMAFSSQILDIIVPLNESRPKVLPVEIYYFINYSEDYYYYWIMLHMALNGVLQAFSIICFESGLAFLAEHACCIFKITGLRLQNINSNNNEEKNLKKVFFCIEQHNRAIEFCNNIESFYGPCFLFAVALNSVIISVCLTQVALNLDDLKLVLKYGFFTGTCLFELLFNSIFSQRIINYSTGLTDVIYDGSWYQMPIKIRKILLPIMMRSREPCKLTAVKMLDISLSTTCSILNACFSYFTLLMSSTT